MRFLCVCVCEFSLNFVSVDVSLAWKFGYTKINVISRSTVSLSISKHFYIKTTTEMTISTGLSTGCVFVCACAMAEMKHVNGTHSVCSVSYIYISNMMTIKQYPLSLRIDDNQHRTANTRTHTCDWFMWICPSPTLFILCKLFDLIQNDIAFGSR